MKKERIEKFYSDFLPRTVEGLKISIAPLRNDIPELRSVGFDRRDNSFNIDFETGNEASIQTFKDEFIEICNGANSGKISNITIFNANKFDEIIVHFSSAVEKIIKDSEQKVIESASLKEKLKWVGRFDLIDRQLKESKDILETSLAS